MSHRRLFVSRRAAQQSTEPSPPRRTGLLGRDVLRRVRPFGAAALAVLGWGNSAATTTLCTVWVEQQLTRGWSLLGVGIGLLVAFVLTVAQILTSDVAPGWYRLALAPDVLMTAAVHQVWTVFLLTFFFGGTVGAILGWIAALLIGYWSARLPEKLVFGERLTTL